MSVYFLDNINQAFFRRLTFSFLGSLLVGFFLSSSPVFAATGNIDGFAWGGGVTSNPPGYDGIGWISMNSSDCDANDDQKVDNAVCGIIGSTIALYGVTIPSTNADLSGYAWSEHYGWISFNPVDVVGCPSGSCNARRVGDMLAGWARILSIRDAGANSGGWSGWISLSDINSGGSGAGYGVKISQMTKNGTNPTYAYSDELGWIDFSRSGFQSTLKICEGSFQRALGISPVPLGSGGATTLTTRYGNGTCSTDPLVNANWAKTNTPDNAVVLSALLPSVISNANTVTVTAISVTGIPSKSENITATYLGKTQTAQVAVSCIARTCPGLSAQTDTYCATESQSFDNTCGGTVSCAGTRNCDYNWKEAAP
jgi:hypothetical protein